LKGHARTAVWACAILAVASRWLLRAPQLEGFDSVGFARALDSYDIVARTPHFPGYPLYILAARLFHVLGLPHVDALIAPGALGAGALVWFSALTAHRLSSERAAVLAALLAWLLPGFQLVGARPLSEGLGVAVLAWCVLLTLRLWDGQGSAFWCGILAGALLGIRPAWIAAPAGLFLPFLFKHPAAGRRLVLGAAGGCLAWLGALVLMTPREPLLEAAHKVLVGHFTVWGGTVVSDPDAGPRASRLLWGFWVWALGGPTWKSASFLDGITALVLVMSLLGAWRFWARAAPLVSALVLTALYILVGTNPDNPRHMTQWLVVLLPFLAMGLERLGRVAAAAPLLVGISCLSPALEQATQASPAAQIAGFLALLEPAQPRFYGFTTVRTVEWMNPGTHVKLVETLPDAAADLAENPSPGPVLFESRLGGKRRRNHTFEPVGTFTRDPRVDPTGSAITVYILLQSPVALPSRE
jgi:hypothetical protein